MQFGLFSCNWVLQSIFCYVLHVCVCVGVCTRQGPVWWWWQRSFHHSQAAAAGFLSWPLSQAAALPPDGTHCGNNCRMTENTAMGQITSTTTIQRVYSRHACCISAFPTRWQNVKPQIQESNDCSELYTLEMHQYGFLLVLKPTDTTHTVCHYGFKLHHAAFFFQLTQISESIKKRI